jgi:hypothetical protein
MLSARRSRERSHSAFFVKSRTADHEVTRTRSYRCHLDRGVPGDLPKRTERDRSRTHDPTRRRTSRTIVSVLCKQEVDASIPFVSTILRRLGSGRV